MGHGAVYSVLCSVGSGSFSVHRNLVLLTCAEAKSREQEAGRAI